MQRMRAAQRPERVRVPGQDRHLEIFPDLDPVSDNWAIGAIQGHTGAAGTLAALCAAHASVIEREAPVLVASTSDRFERAAAVLTFSA